MFLCMSEFVKVNAVAGRMRIQLQNSNTDNEKRQLFFAVKNLYTKTKKKTRLGHFKLGTKKLELETTS